MVVLAVKALGRGVVGVVGVVGGGLLGIDLDEGRKEEEEEVPDGEKDIGVKYSVLKLFSFLDDDL